MPFDRESGQIFHETTMHVKKRCRCHPNRHRRGVKPPTIEERHISRSLQDVAMRTLLRNLGALDENALRPLPVHILERLWSTIKYYLLDNVRLWQLFASVGGLKFEQRRWRADSNCQRHGLKNNIQWAASPSIAWLTDLAIFQLSCSVDELMYINELPNLRSLVVQKGDHDKSCLSDSILREWAYSAQRYGTLSYLQKVFLADQNVTKWCLQYLNQFPSLDTFCVLRCQFDDQHGADKIAQQVGWSLDKRRCAVEMAMGHLSKASSLANSWVHMATGYAEHRRTAEHSTVNDLPRLELSFGSAGQKSRMAMEQFSVEEQRLFCFQRSRGSEPADADTANVNMQERTEVATHVQGEPAKRRKVKDSKIMPLQQHIFFEN